MDAANDASRRDGKHTERQAYPANQRCAVLHVFDLNVGGLMEASVVDWDSGNSACSHIFES